VGLDEGRICKRKVDTLDEMFVRIFDSASHMKKREDKLRQETRDLRTAVSQVHTGWRWDLLTFTANCNKFVI
jgi:hypothetical protein